MHAGRGHTHRREPHKLPRHRIARANPSLARQGLQQRLAQIGRIERLGDHGIAAPFRRQAARAVTGREYDRDAARAPSARPPETPPGPPHSRRALRHPPSRYRPSPARASSDGAVATTRQPEIAQHILEQKRDDRFVFDDQDVLAVQVGRVCGHWRSYLRAESAHRPSPGQVTYRQVREPRLRIHAH